MTGTFTLYFVDYEYPLDLNMPESITYTTEIKDYDSSTKVYTIDLPKLPKTLNYPDFVGWKPVSGWVISKPIIESYNTIYTTQTEIILETQYPFTSDEIEGQISFQIVLDLTPKVILSAEWGEF